MKLTSEGAALAQGWFHDEDRNLVRDSYPKFYPEAARRQQVLKGLTVDPYELPCILCGALVGQGCTAVSNTAMLERMSSTEPMTPGIRKLLDGVGRRLSRPHDERSTGTNSTVSDMARLPEVWGLVVEMFEGMEK